MAADEIPTTRAQIVELAVWVQKNHSLYGDTEELLVGYLIGECGNDPLLVFEALRDVWPEAAAKVELPA